MERALVGCLLADGSSFSRLAHVVRPDFIVTASLKTVFSAMSRLFLSKKPIDMITVSDELRKMGKLDEIGGVIFLAELASETPTSANLDHYVDVVKECWRSRKVVDRLSEIGSAIKDYSIPNREIDRMIHELALSGEKYETERKIEDSLDVSKKTVQLIESIKARQENGTLSPMRPHIKEVDDLVPEYTPGELIVIAGRPSHGKTAFAMQSCYTMAEAGIRVGVISIEMPNNSLMLRRVSQKTHIPLHVLRGPTKLSPSQYGSVSRCLGDLSELSMLYDDNAYKNIETLIARMDFMVKQHGVQVFMIDYLQLIGHNERTENDGISHNCFELKNFAKKNNVPVILLSQLKRLEDGKKPGLQDLRGSGSIEQDADVVVFVYRPAADREKRPKKFIVRGREVDIDTHAELIVAKNRNGSQGSALVGFKPHIVMFHDVEEQEQSDGEPF